MPVDTHYLIQEWKLMVNKYSKEDLIANLKAFNKHAKAAQKLKAKVDSLNKMHSEHQVEIVASDDEDKGWTSKHKAQSVGWASKSQFKQRLESWE